MCAPPWIRVFGVAALVFGTGRATAPVLADESAAAETAAAIETAPVDYETQVAPILENNCLYCHGEDDSESGLRLDSRVGMLRGGDSGVAAVVAGEPDRSYLVEVINHVDPTMAMPPDEDQLDAADIAILTRWIEEGAVWPGQMDATADDGLAGADHWAFQPVVRPPVPQADDAAPQSPIDAFLNQRLTEAGLTMNPPAEPALLARRVGIVLTGLPPTPQRVAEFVAASENDPDAAYAELVEELLASPHFGERWAQHWLDVIRWAETNGSEANLYRKNAWVYRDYVVGSFNGDKPYDQFLREQIAGDTFGVGEATGYLVAGPHVPASTIEPRAAAARFSSG